MAAARKCDRCGEYFVGTTKIENYTCFAGCRVSYYSNQDGRHVKEDLVADLCPECILSFSRWMDEGGSDE